MKTHKKFVTTGIKVYRLSYGVYDVSFDTEEEVIAFIENERKLHPRSKKLNLTYFNTETKTRHRL